MKLWVKLSLILAFICTAAAGMIILMEPPERGHLRLSIADAYTLAPVKNACIVFPQNSASYMSDDHGTALAFSVEADEASAFCSFGGAQYAECTFVVYADGYLPCVWQGVHVYPSRMRECPTVFLFPKGSEGVSVTVFTEAPDDEAAQKLVDRFNPSR